MAYAVQYTLGVLTGAYARKYSVIIYDAARLEGFLRAEASPLAGIAVDGSRREFDPYECFQGVMKMLKRDGKKQFCTAIVRTDEAGETRGIRFEDADDAGAFSVEAYGFGGVIRRGDVAEAFETVQGQKASYRAECASVLSVFKEELMNLLNLCEEGMAKDSKIIAQTVPNDTPAPAPLFQL
ncbi:MAG: hypothetical protein IKY83_07610 [Proteobacteria bacterium]|nr:hypothetical protein [Pseudomonadota bacterium]